MDYTKHFVGDGCIPPHSITTPEVDPAAKAEFFAKLHELEAEVAVAKAETLPPYNMKVETQVQAAKEDLELSRLVEEANAAFDVYCQERHEMGEEKYGPIKFLGANTLEEAMAEVIDLSNYARYTFIKLFLLNVMASKLVQDQFGDNGPAMLGKNSFAPNSNKFKGNG